MDDIKVSICMTTYNHEPYVAQAVESALVQRVAFPIEIVIGEDCSTDRTREILQELAQRHPDSIRLRLSEHNVGGKANFLATLALCRGQYVAMLEGDDYWTCTDKLRIQVEALDANPEWAICFHPSACLYEDGMQGVPVYPSGWTKPVATIEDLLAWNFMATSSVLFRNRLFPAFPSWFCNLVIGDWPLHILNAAHGDIGFLPDTMSVYRIHRGGLWSGATPAARLISVFEMFNAIDHHFEGKYAGTINQYRANAINAVMGELESAKHRAADVAEQLRRAQRQAESEAAARSQTQAQAEAIAIAHAKAQAEAEAAAQVHSQSIAHVQAEALAHATAQAHQSYRSSCLEVDLKSTQNHRYHLLSDFVLLQEKYAALWDEKLLLQAFHDTWVQSIPFRVEREIRRPFRRLRRVWKRWLDARNQQRQPKDDLVSKAA